MENRQQFPAPTMVFLHGSTPVTRPAIADCGAHGTDCRLTTPSRRQHKPGIPGIVSAHERLLRIKGRKRDMDTLWNFFLSQRKQNGSETLGPLGGFAFRFAPRNLLFILSRYKFCAKMLAGKKHVLEVGCGDGTGIPIMLQCVDRMTGVDLNQNIINDDIRRFAYEPRVTFQHIDKCSSLSCKYDAAIALDVLEHIPHETEDGFMQDILATLEKHGVVIMGTPNVTAFQYQNELVKKDHINMQSHESLKNYFSKYFENVFLFSMNDEVVHTGFYPMAHYLFAVGVGKIRSACE